MQILSTDSMENWLVVGDWKHEGLKVNYIFVLYASLFDMTEWKTFWNILFMKY